MKNKIQQLLRVAAVSCVILAGGVAMSAQNSLPAPGAGGGYRPTGGAFGQNGIGWNPGPVAPSYWGSPWYTGMNPSPTVVISPSVSIGNSMNQGITKVIACGYDAQGVWRVLPLLVSYQYDGVQYDVNVLNAWNPWIDQWDRGIDTQAFNTNYILRNITYNYYVVLPFGTFYFNL